MPTDLSKAIREMEERVTALRLRTSAVDVAPDAALDEIAKVLDQARTLLRDAKLSVEDVEEPQPRPAARAGADDWSELLRDPYFRTDRSGTITAINAAAAELLGVPRYFVVGRPLSMFMTPETRAAMRAHINHLASVERLNDVDVDVRRSDGSVTSGSLSAMTVFDDGQIVAIRWVLRADRTPPSAGRASAEPPLPGEGFGRRTAFLAALSGVLSRSLDHDETLEALSRLSLPLLGDWCIVDVLDDHGVAHRRAVSCAPGEPAELRALLLARAPVLNTDHTIMSAVLAGGPGRVVRDSVAGFPAPIAATAEERSVLERLHVTSALVVPLAARGQTLGAVTYLMARSRRRHGAGDLALAEEVGTRAGILVDNARLYHAAQQASRAKSDFLASMSHELRTPLTAVIGYTEILLDEIVGPLAPVQKEQLARIRASSEHLLVLVEEILTFARLEAGREEVVLEPVDTHAVVDQAVTLIALQAQVRQLTLNVDPPPEPTRFVTDPPKLRQILVNLLANAVKFTTRGEVGIRARVRPPWVTFEVWDTGIGIPSEHLDRIFAPFWQVDQRFTRSYGGSGLGLAVVRRLTRLLGGEVTVRSQVGVGSHFEVRIPGNGPPAALSSREPSPAPPAARS